MRAACAFFLAVALPASVACAETAQGPLAGASDAWASVEPTSSARVVPRTTWDGYAEVQRSPAVTSVPFTSRGHQPEQQVDVRANEVARAEYAALVADTVFPDGALIAQLSHTGTGNGYVMRKNAGVWSYFELDAQGALLESGALGLCAGCHSQAPADRIFGLPRPP